MCIWLPSSDDWWLLTSSVTERCNTGSTVVLTLIPGLAIHSLLVRCGASEGIGTAAPGSGSLIAREQVRLSIRPRTASAISSRSLLTRSCPELRPG